MNTSLVMASCRVWLYQKDSTWEAKTQDHQQKLTRFTVTLHSVKTHCQNRRCYSHIDSTTDDEKCTTTLCLKKWCTHIVPHSSHKHRALWIKFGTVNRNIKPNTLTHPMRSVCTLVNDHVFPLKILPMIVIACSSVLDEGWRGSAMQLVI